MKVLTSNKQEQAIQHLANIHKYSREDDFVKRIDSITDELLALAIIIGGEASMLRLTDKVCAEIGARMKGADDE